MEKEMELVKKLEALIMKDCETVANKGQITPADYQSLGCAVKIWKDLDTIKAMHEYGAEQGGVSGRMYPIYGNSYDAMPNNHMNSMGMQPMNSGYFPMESYDASFARGRSPYTGRYVSRDGEMQAKLNHMMQTANTEQERQIIQRMMNEM